MTDEKNGPTRDQKLGEKLRDEGIERAATAADPVWTAAAHAAFDGLLVTRDTFTADDVWESLALAGVSPPEEKRALARVFTAARSHGQIEAVGPEVSRLPSRHRGYVTRWRVLRRPAVGTLTPAAEPRVEGAAPEHAPPAPAAPAGPPQQALPFGS